MLTTHPRKFWLALASLLVVAGSYLLTGVGLNQLAVWAESRPDVYPYMTGEDSIRYLLPTKMRDYDQPLMFLAGSSTTNEGMLYERINAAFPEERVYQGAVSTGTLDDVLVLLDFTKRQYGEQALPETLVLGVSLRFMANLPRRFGPDRDKSPYSPVFNTIRHYTPYVVNSTPTGSKLSAKGSVRTLESRLLYLFAKQQPRYVAASVALLDSALAEMGVKTASEAGLPLSADIRNLFEAEKKQAIWSYAQQVGVASFLRLWASVYLSPYQTRYMPPRDLDKIAEELGQEGHFWSRVYRWNPREDEALLRSQINDLLSFTRQHGIELFVVNLPESHASRQFYNPRHYADYLTIVQDSLGDVPFLDLSDQLPESYFFDEEHPTYAGAQKVTARIIEFIRQNRSMN